ncbi:MAG: hypothetical protein WD802_05250 [Gemmatimonadaceae bacterium]
MKYLVLFPCVAALAAPGALAQDTTATAPDTSYVEYADPPISLPLGVGLRVPSYDRVNGLTVPWGPKLIIGYDKIDLDALVSYRSHLGNWDPSVQGSFRPGYGNEIRLFVGRGTFSNDDWIRADLMNSAASLVVGSDARNYYRADRGALRYTRNFTTSAATIAPFIGGSVEKGWSTGSLTPVKTPWSAFGRTDTLKMRRPNPAVLKGQINSVLGGIGLELFRGEMEAKLGTTVEHAFRAPVETCTIPPGGPVCTIDRGSFTQGTIHGTANFPTFGAQTFAFRTHAILSTDTVPPQRYAYLGGTGSLPTVDLLAFGGDRLFFVEAEYMIPLERIMIMRFGSPFIALRYAAGTAGVRDLPSLTQNLGIGLGLSVLRVDYHIDPASNRSVFSDRSAISFGLSIPR